MDENRMHIRRLTRAICRMDGAYYYFARQSGTKENLLTLLYALDDGRPHSQREICEDWLVPKTTINTIVRELVAQGQAALLPSEGSREKTICLTEAGRAYAQRALRTVYEAEDVALARILNRHSSDFIDVLEEFADLLNEEYANQLGADAEGKDKS